MQIACCLLCVLSSTRNKFQNAKRKRGWKYFQREENKWVRNFCFSHHHYCCCSDTSLVEEQRFFQSITERKCVAFPLIALWKLMISLNGKYLISSFINKYKSKAERWLKLSVLISKKWFYSCLADLLSCWKCGNSIDSHHHVTPINGKFAFQIKSSAIDSFLWTLFTVMNTNWTSKISTGLGMTSQKHAGTLN